MRIYEAIVVNSAPTGAPPGHITVKCPELGGDNELPFTVAPLYPGWTAGGWHSVPQAVPPETDVGVTEVRVLVAALSQYDLRWIGTSQQWSEITDNSATRCGARSPKGHHKIIVDDDVGVQIVVSEASSPTGAKNYLSIGADNSVQIGTKDGDVFYINGSTISLVNSDGDTFVMSGSNGISLVHHGGADMISVADGAVKVIGGDVQVVGGAVTVVGQGGVTLTDSTLGATPTNKMVLGDAFMQDLMTFLTACAGDAAMSPGVAAGANVFLANVIASIAFGSPYLSNVSKTA